MVEVTVKQIEERNKRKRILTCESRLIHSTVRLSDHIQVKGALSPIRRRGDQIDLEKDSLRRTTDFKIDGGLMEKYDSCRKANRWNECHDDDRENN